MDIKTGELKKFTPMGLMLMFIMFIGGIVAPMRDALMVKVAICGGAGTTVILKLVAAPLASILLMVVFIKLTKKYSTAQVLTLVVLFFVGFFLLFGTILFSLRNHLQMSEATIKYWQAIFPHAHWIIVCIGNWLLSLFYIMCGLWTVAALPLTFWHIANTYTTREEAKKYFGFLNLLGSVGGFSAGYLSQYLNKKANSASSYEQCVLWQLVITGIVGAFLILTGRFLFKRVIKDDAPMASQMKSKEKMGIWNSIKYIATGKKAVCVALLAASYYMVMNPVEAAWKDQMKIASSNASEFHAANSRVLVYINLIIIVLSLVMTVSLKKFKWQTTALITPILLGTFGLSFMIISEQVNVWGSNMVLNGKMLVSWAIMIGTIAIWVTKGCKKSVFDTTKNLAYRILPPEDRLTARLATETCGSRMGEVIGNAVPAILTNIIFPGASVTSKKVLPCMIIFTVTGLIIWLFVISKIQKYTVE